MVENVPSIHICYEFIPELLGQPRLEQQMFAISIITNLLQKIPNEGMHELDEKVIIPYFKKYLSANLTTAIIKNQPRFSKVVIQSIISILKVFPDLEDECFYVIQGKFTHS